MTEKIDPQKLVLTEDLLKLIRFEERIIGQHPDGSLKTIPIPEGMTDWFLRDAKLPGFSVRVTGKGLRFYAQRKLAGQPCRVECGAWPETSLTKARKNAEDALARIKLGLQDCVFLGNLDAKRDWGHAKDYVEMQWLMLQQEQPEDFVIATGVQYSVRDFVAAAAAELGMHIRWQGKGVDEKGYDAGGKCVVAVDPRYFRPTEVETLLGDASKAKDKLGWTPKISFAELVAEMVREDLKSAERDELIKKHGYKAMDYNE